MACFVKLVLAVSQHTQGTGWLDKAQFLELPVFTDIRRTLQERDYLLLQL